MCASPTPIRLPPSHQCNLRVRNCLTLPHTNTLEYTLHTCSGVQVRNNSPRRVLGTQQHCESCPASLCVSSSGAHHGCPLPIMGAHGCPWVPPPDTHSAPITIVTGVDTHCLCQPSNPIWHMNKLRLIHTFTQKQVHSKTKTITHKHAFTQTHIQTQKRHTPK